VSAAATPGLRRVEHVMGMPIVVDVRDEVEGAVLDDVFAWLVEVDARFSPYRDDSEASRVRRGELALDDAHPDVRWIYARCDELRRETDGYFDPAVVDGDPSGVVKGWAVDRAGARLEAAGLCNWAVYAGGDILLRGAGLPETAWRVGIQHPLRRDRVARTLTANDLAVATSGAYARGEHVLDPHTGRPPAGVLSVTITGPDLTVADAYATAAFAMGARGPEWTRGLVGYEALSILADETMLRTAGFPAP
jgi:thiamine biosynthesis lipoprotein